MDPHFDHEQLDVYQVAREFNRALASFLARVPPGQSESRDNLTRAAKSITRNIAEGSGKWRVRDKVHFYHIARGSATECAASLDELVDYGVVSDAEIQSLKQPLARVVAMLIAMIRSLESRGRPDMGR